MKHRWQLLVRLTQRTFEDEVVPEEVVWATVVFLPKGKGEYRGIELVEVAWKVCAELSTQVKCDDALRTAWVQGG